MARKKKDTTIKEIMQMAQSYGVAENALFQTALKNYETVQKSIRLINETLDNEELTVKKEYVKGRENVCIHPLIKELPKHVEMANKTIDLLMKIITTYGVVSESDELIDFIGGR